jgi:hypothetical protein
MNLTSIKRPDSIAEASCEDVVSSGDSTLIPTVQRVEDLATADVTTPLLEEFKFSLKALIVVLLQAFLIADVQEEVVTKCANSMLTELLLIWVLKHWPVLVGCSAGAWHELLCIVGIEAAVEHSVRSLSKLGLVEVKHDTGGCFVHSAELKFQFNGTVCRHGQRLLTTLAVDIGFQGLTCIYALSYQVLREEVAIVVVSALDEDTTHKIGLEKSENLVALSFRVNFVQNIKDIGDNGITACGVDKTGNALDTSMLRDACVKDVIVQMSLEQLGIFENLLGKLLFAHTEHFDKGLASDKDVLGLDEVLTLNLCEQVLEVPHLNTYEGVEETLNSSVVLGLGLTRG